MKKDSSDKLSDLTAMEEFNKLKNYAGITDSFAKSAMDIHKLATTSAAMEEFNKLKDYAGITDSFAKSAMDIRELETSAAMEAFNKLKDYAGITDSFAKSAMDIRELETSAAMEAFKKFNNPVGVSTIETANNFKNLMQRASILSIMELQKPPFLDAIKSTSGSNENIVRYIEASLNLGLEQERLQFFQDYDDCVINDIATITECHANFNNAIADIEKLLNTSIDSTVKNSFYRLLYANVITALETYLADAFINTVLSNPSFVRRLVETTPKFKEEKIIFSDIYKSISNIEVKISEYIEIKVREYLADFIWHNLAVVGKMYKDTLSIRFPDNMGAIYKAIVIRHDIVHRNGKDKSGEEKIISQQDIMNLIAKIEELVQHIDSSLNELKSKSSTDTKNIWDAIQTFRNQLEPGDLEPDEEVFSEVRDSSPGREVSF